MKLIFSECRRPGFRALFPPGDNRQSQLHSKTERASRKKICIRHHLLRSRLWNSHASGHSQNSPLAVGSSHRITLRTLTLFIILSQVQPTSRDYSASDILGQAWSLDSRGKSKQTLPGRIETWSQQLRVRCQSLPVWKCIRKNYCSHKSDMSTFQKLLDLYLDNTILGWYRAPSTKCQDIKAPSY